MRVESLIGFLFVGVGLVALGSVSYVAFSAYIAHFGLACVVLA